MTATSQRLGWIFAMVGGCASLADAQGRTAKRDPGPSSPQNPQRIDLRDLRKYASYFVSNRHRDSVEFVFANGVRLPFGQSELRADRVVVTVDRDEYYRATSSTSDRGLPSRGMTLPGHRRTLTTERMAARFERFLASLGRRDPSKSGGKLASESDRQTEFARLFRSIYLSGNVVVTDGGIEVLTAKSLMLSVVDDRVVLENATMRLLTKNSRGEQALILRAPRLVKVGNRTTGRMISLTTCSAGKPHFEVFSGQAEIIEREDQFEVVSRDNTLAFSGRRTLPLPDVRFFTKEQSQIPIKGVRINRSSRDGLILNVDLGSSMNDVGGAVHEFLTGDAAKNFRGDWRLGLNYNENRGFPLDLQLEYQGGDLYRGRFLGFSLLDDGGRDWYLIQNNIDGSPITEKDRSIIHTETRFFLGDSWTADLSLFSASDPSVWSEFFQDLYNQYEIPESSLHLRHAEDNRLFTLTGRTNLATFTYGDDRALTPAFREELPVATYDVFAERLFGIGDVDVLLTSSTNTGWLRHEFDPRFNMPVRNKTLRLNQELEVAAPFHWGPIAIRPHASAQLTYYDNTTSGRSDERWAFDAGISITTRVARSFPGEGQSSGIRHSVYPSISFGHVYKVDGTPSDYYQFDELDSLEERGVIRVGVLNRFETLSQRSPAATASATARGGPPADPRDPLARDIWRTPGQNHDARREFLYVDLAQNFLPLEDRDNNGHGLGLFEYELIWRPHEEWIPVRNLRFLFEGEHDWNASRLRTMNAAMRFDNVLGCNWDAGYRTDHTTRGALQYGANTNLFGRWGLSGMGAYDLQLKDQLYYGIFLDRRDHDWHIQLGITHNAITGDTSFNVDFRPLFGGLFRQRSQLFGGMQGEGPNAMLY